jgi:lipopolysaccharide transport system ATP-binding protein
MSSETAIKVENLSKCYQVYNQPHDRLKQSIYPRFQRAFGGTQKQYFREFWALRDVSFEVARGETLAIIGRNGSGKSTLLQLICGTLNPTAGDITCDGRIAALLELGSGFNPEFTGRENAFMNAAVLGLTTEEAEERYDDIVAFADIVDFMDQPVKTYSSGMIVRLAFAVAINVRAQILIIDEALAVGDVAFQRKCMRRLEELKNSGVTLLFVSHDTETVKKICSSAIYLERGVIRHRGTAKEVCMEYERDLFGASRSAAAAAPAKPKDVPAPQLDQELLKSDEKTYGDGRVAIQDIAISDADGNAINVVPPGIRFTVSYKTVFSEDIERPVFGMMITNREGVCVFGTNTSKLPVSRQTHASGDEVCISFDLSNNLGPGIYYLTCGVHADDKNGGLIYLQRRMDTLIFKSLANDEGTAAGMTNLFAQIAISQKNSLSQQDQ